MATGRYVINYLMGIAGFVRCTRISIWSASRASGGFISISWILKQSDSPFPEYIILVALHSMLLGKHIWDLNGQFWSSKGHLMKSPFWHYQRITNMHIAAKPKLHTTLKLFDALLFKNFFYHFALKDGSWWSSNVMRISATKEFSPWG